MSVMWTNFKKMPNTNSKNNKLSKIDGIEGYKSERKRGALEKVAMLA